MESVSKKFNDSMQNISNQLSTKISKDDLIDIWVDNYGVKYSRDKKKLLKAPKDIEHYSIIEGTIMLCDSSFSGSNIQTIYIPNSVTYIGDGAFSNCTFLNNVTLPPNLKKLSDNIFYNCDHLTQISIPTNITSIGNDAFNNCINLKFIEIPESVIEIKSEAFYRSGIRLFKLYDNIEKIGKLGHSCISPWQYNLVIQRS